MQAIASGFEGMRHGFDDAVFELNRVAVLIDGDEPRHRAPLAAFVFTERCFAEPVLSAVDEPPASQARDRRFDRAERAVACIEKEIGRKNRPRLVRFDDFDAGKRAERLGDLF